MRLRRARWRALLHFSVLTTATLAGLTHVWLMGKDSEAGPVAAQPAAADFPASVVQAALFAVEIAEQDASIADPEPETNVVATPTSLGFAGRSIPSLRSACESSASSVYCSYQVRPGDTLSGIAQEFGLKGGAQFTGADVLALNNELDVSSSTALRPGAIVRVPAISALIHAVAPAETLGDIATHYGVDSSEIRAIAENRVSDSGSLLAGQELLIPATPSSLTVVAVKIAAKNAARAPVTAPPANSPQAEETATDSRAVAESSPDAAPAVAGSMSATEGPPDGAGEWAFEALAAERAQEDTPETEAATPAEPSPDATEKPSPTPEPSATPTATPTATPEATATKPPATATPGPNAAGTPTPRSSTPPPPLTAAEISKIQEDFAAGYRSAAGPEEHLQHILQKVMRCESGFNVRAYNPAGPYYGLMQFSSATWAVAGGGDWFDARQQGVNTARLLKLRNPLTQWPVCWLK